MLIGRVQRSDGQRRMSVNGVLGWNRLVHRNDDDPVHLVGGSDGYRPSHLGGRIGQAIVLGQDIFRKNLDCQSGRFASVQGLFGVATGIVVQFLARFHHFGGSRYDLVGTAPKRADFPERRTDIPTFDVQQVTGVAFNRRHVVRNQVADNRQVAARVTVTGKIEHQAYRGRLNVGYARERLVIVDGGRWLSVQEFLRAGVECQNEQCQPCDGDIF